MAKELMQIEIDSGLKKEFLECINHAYKGKTEEGIIDLIRIYVERAKGSPRQKEIKNKVQQFVFEGEAKSGITPLEIEKLVLNKTDEDIEAARLDKSK